MNLPSCPPALWKKCLVALPVFCAANRMIPSRYAPRGHLVVDYESSVPVGGVHVRHGTLDGIVVTIQTTSNDLAGSSGGGHEVRIEARTPLRVFMPLPERLQRSRYLEEPEPPKYPTSPRNRYIHFPTFYYLGTCGIWKLERLSYALPECLEVKIGEQVGF